MDHTARQRAWLDTAVAEARAGLLLDDPECVTLMRDFIAGNPALWNEDIGE